MGSAGTSVPVLDWHSLAQRGQVAGLAAPSDLRPTVARSGADRQARVGPALAPAPTCRAARRARPACGRVARYPLRDSWPSDRALQPRPSAGPTADRRRSRVAAPGRGRRLVARNGLAERPGVHRLLWAEAKWRPAVAFSRLPAPPEQAGWTQRRR